MQRHYVIWCHSYCIVCVRTTLTLWSQRWNWQCRRCSLRVGRWSWPSPSAPGVRQTAVPATEECLHPEIRPADWTQANQTHLCQHQKACFTHTSIYTYTHKHVHAIRIHHYYVTYDPNIYKVKVKAAYSKLCVHVHVHVGKAYT